MKSKNNVNKTRKKQRHKLMTKTTVRKRRTENGTHTESEEAVPIEIDVKVSRNRWSCWNFDPIFVYQTMRLAIVEKPRNSRTWNCEWHRTTVYEAALACVGHWAPNVRYSPPSDRLARSIHGERASICFSRLNGPKNRFWASASGITLLHRPLLYSWAGRLQSQTARGPMIWRINFRKLTSSFWSNQIRQQKIGILQ